MLQSIVDDIKGQFSYGNMITKIILVNLFFFLVIKIVWAFSPATTDVYSTFRNVLVLSSDGLSILKKPWTLISHMFFHEGVWHLAWNMILLYWFGRITGDLAGDKRILPLYILGGLAGALAYFIYAQVIGMNGGIAFGASAAVTCLIVAAGFLAPDYIIRLIFIGNVKLKYIAAALVLIDLLMISENNNTGGRIAHLGGALMGGGFVHLLRQGTDLSQPLLNLFNFVSRGKPMKTQSPMKVIHNKKWPAKEEQSQRRTADTQERIDQILDKINDSGYESLTSEEKDFLYQASQD